MPSKNGYRRRRAKGLCVAGYCTRKARPGKALCRDCAKIQLLEMAGERDIRALMGWCAKCGKRPPVAERRHCQKCLDYLRAQGAAHRARKCHPQSSAPHSGQVYTSTESCSPASVENLRPPVFPVRPSQKGS